MLVNPSEPFWSKVLKIKGANVSIKLETEYPFVFSGKYTVKTDKKTVGEALTEVGLISGEVGAYGLMVETVDGETVKYEDGGKYWAFYVDGDYAMTGVEKTKIEEGKTYAFKVE